MFNHPRLRALFSLLMLTIVVIVMNLNIQTDKISKDVNLLAQIVNPYSPSQPAGGNGQSNDSDTASEPKYYCHEYPGNKKYDGMTSHPNPSIDAQIGNQGVRPEIIDNQPGWGISWKAQHDPVRVLQGGGMIGAFTGVDYDSYIATDSFLRNQIKQALANCPNAEIKGFDAGSNYRTRRSGYYTYKGKNYKFTDLAIKYDFGANCYLPPSLPTEARPVHTGPGGTTGGGPQGGATPKFPPQGGTTGGGKSTPPVNNTGGNNPEGGNNQNSNNSNSNSRGLIFDHSFLFETKCNIANKIDYQFLTSKRKLGEVFVESNGYNYSGSNPTGFTPAGQAFIRSLPSSFAGNPINWGHINIYEGIGGITGTPPGDTEKNQKRVAGFVP